MSPPELRDDENSLFAEGNGSGEWNSLKSSLAIPGGGLKLFAKLFMWCIVANCGIAVIKEFLKPFLASFRSHPKRSPCLEPLETRTLLSGSFIELPGTL